tara:strand:+ start:349 stop:591 length:243 start_codon:yes stop_codon:yes gene_type:complete
MFFNHKFKDVLSVIGFDGKTEVVEEENLPTLDEVRLESTRVQRTKASVKSMHREQKQDANFKGRQKIQNLFARRGIYLNI